MMKEIIIEGIVIEIEKKNIKNMYLKVQTDGKVKITAPKRMHESAIREFAVSRIEWIRNHQERIEQRRKNEIPEDKEQFEQYRQELKQVIPKLIAKWEPVLGVKVEAWGVKNMKTRWGSCNPAAKRIWLNLQLGRYSSDCLEYVVVHEMVHLLEPSHNSRFKGLMTGFLPDWIDIRRKLNKN